VLNRSLDISAPIVLLTVVSLLVLYSTAEQLFPTYLVFILLGFAAFYVFSRIDFEVLSLFSWHFYFISMALLILTLAIGQITRGAIRWIPIGSLSFQPAELVRPFLLVFFANYLTRRELTRQSLVRGMLLVVLPVLLIIIQPSLGVSILTAVGFVGVILASGISKRMFIYSILGGIAMIPVAWFLLAPYQKDRIVSFINPEADPSGAGYNSIQSMIGVGSGKIFGRGLGRGVQTQLSFLPERHTDFIFASISEELGMVGSLIVVGLLAFLVLSLTASIEGASSFSSRAFISGVMLYLLVQSVVHIGMNVGLMPVTGLPLPLVSAGGSSYIATMIALGMVVGARK